MLFYWTNGVAATKVFLMAKKTLISLGRIISLLQVNGHSRILMSALYDTINLRLAYKIEVRR